MKRLSVFAIGLLVVAFTFFGCAGQPGGHGWVKLIDGAAGLENWNPIGGANWRTEGDAIVADKGKSGHLVSKKSYRDFEIYAEFWSDHNTNSGIFIRCSDPKNIGAATCYEVNIFDQRPDPTYGTGGIPNFAQALVYMKAGGRWNTYEIYAKGPQLTIMLNGVVTVHTQDSKFASGPITLQYGGLTNNVGGGAIKWRKVQVREL